MSKTLRSKVVDIIAKCPEDLVAALDTLPIGVSITNTSGVVIYYNEAGSQIDDIDPEVMLGSVETEMLLGPDIMKMCQEANRPFLGFIYPYRTRYGKEINAAFWVSPLRENGEVVGSISFTQLLDSEYNRRKSPYIQWPDATPMTTAANKIVGSSPIFTAALRQAHQAGLNPLPVLLTGSTGTGKEMFAAFIHSSSPRNKGPYLTINCAAIPAGLLEGLLFGTTRGSFTGATDRAGLLEEAHGGVLYLDEFDSMPLDLQPKLLRVLQDMRIRRLGSQEERPVDVKIVSSIGCSLQEAIDEKRLRPDIAYRLAVISISIPNLRERVGDLEELINYFLYKYNKLLGRKLEQVEGGLLALLSAYDWPGNVRELEHLVAGMANMARPEDTLLVKGHLTGHYKRIFEKLEGSRDYEPFALRFTPAPEAAAAPPEPSAAAQAAKAGGTAPVRAEDREAIIAALVLTAGNVTLAAEHLGISRQLLSYRMNRHGLRRQDFRPSPSAGRKT